MVIPEEIFKECGKGGKPALWLSTLSTFCHFHGLAQRSGQDSKLPVTRFRHLTTSGRGFPSLISEARRGHHKSVISTREELLDLWRNSAQRPFGITPIVRCPTPISSKSILWGNLGGNLGLARFGTTLAKYLEPRDRAADVCGCGSVEPMEDIS